MNDVSGASDLRFSILSAADTTVLIEGQIYNNVIFTLNTELQKLDVWLQANKLTLNTAKTHYMQGRPQDLAGGGGKKFFFQIWKFACREATCCAWRSHALC